ncbi:MAG: HD domain-containing phosphohydrolase [Bdellovibrionota bacterium]|nr:HD domain-containing phosphohydrolase [Bdellovibrionota bacterium]
MPLDILIADEDEAWAKKLKAYMEEGPYKVALAHNGKEAQLQVYNNKYFAVILNPSIKNHSGQQVLTYISKNMEAQTVIVLLEDESLLKTKELSEEALHKKGVNDILVKPILNQELTTLLESYQSLSDVVSNLKKRKGVSDEQEVKEADTKFTKVHIDKFYPSQAVLFDVFVKINDNRYVKILHSGDTFSQERINKYKKEKNIDHLYFKQKDRRKYIQYTNFLAKKLIDNKKVSAASKVNLLSTVSEKYVEELFQNGVKTQVVDQAKEITSNLYKVVEDQKDLYQTLRDFQELDPSQFTHSFVTSLYTSAIVKQFPWQSKMTIETIAMASMFHDIGKTKLPKKFMDTRPEDLTPEELETYYKHPELGVEIVGKNKLINNSVKQVILQHHECYNGTGFPHQLKGQQVSTLGNILCLVDDFVHIMIKTKKTPTEALRFILTSQEQVSRYNSVIVENFIKVFVDPGTIQSDEKTRVTSKPPKKKAS